MTRYWSMRTARPWNDLLLTELREGRLRQGWGYQTDQDLRTIRAAITTGTPLSDAQKDTWKGNQHLLGDQTHGWQVGDLILIPRFPEYASFSIARVTGRYDFAPIEVPGGGFDLGHIREAVMVAGPLPQEAPPLSASLRATLGHRVRLINIDRYGPELEALARGEAAGSAEPDAATGGRALAQAAYSLMPRIDPGNEGRTNQLILDALLAEGVQPAGQDPRQTLRTALNLSQDLFRIGDGFTWVAILGVDPERADPGLSGRLLAEEAYRLARLLDRARDGLHYESLKVALIEDGTLVHGPNQGQTLASALRNAPDLFEWLDRGRWRWR